MHPGSSYCVPSSSTYGSRWWLAALHAVAHTGAHSTYGSSCLLAVHERHPLHALRTHPTGQGYEAAAWRRVRQRGHMDDGERAGVLSTAGSAG